MPPTSPLVEPSCKKPPFSIQKSKPKRRETLLHRSREMNDCNHPLPTSVATQLAWLTFHDLNGKHNYKLLLNSKEVELSTSKVARIFYQIWLSAQVRVGKTNIVVDALSHKAESATLRMSQLKSGLLSLIKKGLQQDPLMENLLGKELEGKTMRFFVRWKHHSH